MFDCEHYDRENGWCKISINWSDPMPTPSHCNNEYKCSKYRKIKPYEHCESSCYEQACGIWCKKKHQWADTMSGYTGICDDCDENILNKGSV